MKNNLFLALILMIFMTSVNVFSSIGRQDAQYTYTILDAGTTTYIVSITSTTAYPFAYSDESKAVQRTVNIENDTLGVRCILDKSSSTILTNGEYLMPRSFSCFDVNASTMWLKAVAGSSLVDVCLTKVEKTK